MPPADNDVAAGNLTPAQLGLLKLWIDQGIAERAASTACPPRPCSHCHNDSSQCRPLCSHPMAKPSPSAEAREFTCTMSAQENASPRSPIRHSENPRLHIRISSSHSRSMPTVTCWHPVGSAKSACGVVRGMLVASP